MKSKTDESRLLDAVSEAKKSLRFSRRDEGSDSQQSSASSSGEIQRIGTMVVPKGIWGMAWLENAISVRLIIGPEIIEIESKGRWEPPPPKQFSARELPSPKSEESYESYAMRAWKLFRTPRETPEWWEWLEKRKFVGETSNQLLKKLCDGVDLPGYKWRFIQDKKAL